jgi:hypothetical protein
MPNVFVDVNLPTVDCKLDLVTIQGNITGDQYIRDVLPAVVVPHFDNRPNMSQICYMGFKIGLMASQETQVTASLWR